MILSDIEIIKVVTPYTMVSEERIQNVLSSIDDIIQQNIPGDFIEIGVWQGGIIMAMALKCQQLGVNRKIHAYDTFAGMTAPGDADVDYNNNQAKDILQHVLCYSAFENTKHNIDRVNYQNIEYHIGDILHTNLDTIPANIALLRLDTDWYELTKFELQHFEPKVVYNGYIIIDDYGHWRGCKKAIDEFMMNKNCIKLHAIDYTGVYWKKEQ